METENTHKQSKGCDSQKICDAIQKVRCTNLHEITIPVDTVGYLIIFWGGDFHTQAPPLISEKEIQTQSGICKCDGQLLAH